MAIHLSPCCLGLNKEVIKLRQQVAERPHKEETTATMTAAVATLEAERDAARTEVVTLKQSMSALKEVRNLIPVTLLLCIYTSYYFTVLFAGVHKWER